MLNPWQLGTNNWVNYNNNEGITVGIQITNRDHCRINRQQNIGVGQNGGRLKYYSALRSSNHILT